jgi:hypothetical protein
VCAHTKVYLRDRVQAQPVIGVDQQADLDAVARRERHRHQQFAGSRILAAERLQHTAQLGPQRREQWPCHQLGDPATAGGALVAAGVAHVQRPPIEALDQMNAVLGEQRPEQPRHEHRVRVDQIGVDENHDVAAGGRQRAPQHLAFAGPRRDLGQGLFARHDARAGGDRPDLGVVGGSRVEHDQLVDQAADQR